MGRQRRDHFVPQFILRQFCPPDRPGLLHRLDLATGEVRKAQVRTEAQRKDLNTLSPETAERLSVDPRLLERWFSEIEARAAPALRLMVTQGGTVDQQSRLAIAHLLAAQLIRTPRRREWRRNLSTAATKEWVEAMLSDVDHVRRVLFADADVPESVVVDRQQEMLEEVGSGEVVVEPDRDLMTLGHAAFEIEALVPALCDETRWVLASTPAGRRLVIGDDPATLFDPTPKLPGAAPAPLSSDHSEMVLPVSPTEALVIFPGDGSFGREVLTSAQVDAVNLRSLAWATHAVYGQDRRDLHRTRRLAAENPERVKAIGAHPPRVWFDETVPGDEAESTLTSYDGDGVKRVLKGVGLRFDGDAAA